MLNDLGRQVMKFDRIRSVQDEAVPQPQEAIIAAHGTLFRL
jgi:hypothetical protein